MKRQAGVRSDGRSRSARYPPTHSPVDDVHVSIQSSTDGLCQQGPDDDLGIRPRRQQELLGAGVAQTEHLVAVPLQAAHQGAVHGVPQLHTAQGQGEHHHSSIDR